MRILNKEIDNVRRSLYLVIRKRDFLEALIKSKNRITEKEKFKMKKEVKLLNDYIQENLRFIQKILWGGF